MNKIFLSYFLLTLFVFSSVAALSLADISRGIQSNSFSNIFRRFFGSPATPTTTTTTTSTTIQSTTTTTSTTLPLTCSRQGNEVHVYTTGGCTDIQTAINTAQNGDSVILHTGTYYPTHSSDEAIRIDKSITLMKDPEDEEVKIDAGGRNVGIEIYVPSGDVEIIGLKISNFHEGIVLSSSPSATISGNTILGSYSSRAGFNNFYGIVLSSSSSATISGNTISGNYYGIALSSSSSATITENIIKSNVGYGIVASSSSATITENTISSNFCGIFLHFSSATITENTISGSFDSGIDLSSSSSATISGNTISSNNYGIVASSSSATITENIIINNGVGISCGSPSIITNIEWFPAGNIFSNRYGDCQGDCFTNPQQQCTQQGSMGVGVIDNQDNRWGQQGCLEDYELSSQLDVILDDTIYLQQSCGNDNLPYFNLPYFITNFNPGVHSFRLIPPADFQCQWYIFYGEVTIDNGLGFDKNSCIFDFNFNSDLENHFLWFIISPIPPATTTTVRTTTTTTTISCQDKCTILGYNSATCNEEVSAPTCASNLCR